ncbi:uncharacterized protein SCHCODRAFT_02596540 [Schizophyllum commune H4-8]|uniref:Uncharacterized protein n=1 Tax=Schizophyllum commune (strain H4-8 / FGSC 9210) TaxID=578458 RepID=D8PK43_SCHCM|nr:uncharacterized protein SCHCODRAFT_02596540 [Schizophyllum commune H4-8]KAI5897745.1 hypothetical protein SCHCODRAFT_02596540 [Schizophyllum commune H4-8]
MYHPGLNLYYKLGFAFLPHASSIDTERTHCALCFSGPAISIAASDEDHSGLAIVFLARDDGGGPLFRLPQAPGTQSGRDTVRVAKGSSRQRHLRPPSSSKRDKGDLPSVLINTASGIAKLTSFQTRRMRQLPPPIQMRKGVYPASRSRGEGRHCPPTPLPPEACVRSLG